MDSFNKEMERIKQENKEEFLKDRLAQFTKNEINTLRKAGLTIEEIADIEDPSINPFKNYSLAERSDVTDLLEA